MTPMNHKQQIKKKYENEVNQNEEENVKQYRALPQTKKFYQFDKEQGTKIKRANF